METSPTPRFNPRIGFHYYPDPLHYRQFDLDAWLPELKRLGASWLALVAPATRAIPESFLRGLLDAGIEPVLHFPFHCQPGAGDLTLQAAPGCGSIPTGLPAYTCPPVDSLRLLLSSYARWGVRYTVFFDRPNCRSSWPAAAWLQGELVEQFLDLFLPVANMAQAEGLTPVFPPLAPGGDFWDLSFLRLALQGLQRRGADSLLDGLALSAEAWVGAHPLDWGLGGPERWPGARPYAADESEPDQRGFRIFDWYRSVCQQELGRALPLILLRLGQHTTGDALASTGAADAESAAPAALAARVHHARQNLAIAQLLAAAPENAAGIPAEVLAGCFWLLTAAHHPAAAAAWYPPAGLVLPAAGALQQWVEYTRTPVAGIADPGEPVETAINDGSHSTPVAAIAEPGAVGETAIAEGGYKSLAISHYVLLPLYAWGAANWDLTLIQPLVNEAHPTIGFSLAEARLARRVTVVGGPGAVSTQALSMLRAAGCQVERLLEDGTLVAT